MTSDSEEFEDIIRVIETENQKTICLIRIYREASVNPRPIIELNREDQQYFTYDVLKSFDNIQQAHDYAEEHEIWDVVY
jgi:hypothetical protein